MSRPFGLAAVQMAVEPWDPKATAKKMSVVAHQIAYAFPWVDMIVYPELTLSAAAQFGRPPTPREMSACRADIPGALTDDLCQLAKRLGRWLVPGSLYETDGDAVYNTAVAISPDGEIVARYRKIFPWYPYETESTPGNEYTVFDVPNVGRFGLSICYDMWFPETVRTLAWMGAEVILHPTLTTTQDRELETVLSRAHAITNQVFFLDVNAVGSWGGGRSSLVHPDGHVLHHAGEGEAFFVQHIDLDDVKRTREVGTLGVTQTWKQLRDHGMRFPPYQAGYEQGAVFDELGELKIPSR
ncbi:MAG: carbon-nitrogen hydrolase family protein [Truepera sp.]|jgi:formamidase|nr:carbon-nitrogen hydrolase family protein [Truepera sp.]HRN17777.1 carbon-nitrogen hydrolase family protein [Trueperaceae bacterium]